MTIPPSVFALLIMLALAIVIVAPLVLVGLWIADLKEGELW